MPSHKSRNAESPGQQPLLGGEQLDKALVDEQFPFACECEECGCYVVRKHPGICTLCEIGAHGIGKGGFACTRL